MKILKEVGQLSKSVFSLKEGMVNEAKLYPKELTLILSSVDSKFQDILKSKDLINR
jgi:hypothetical protein